MKGINRLLSVEVSNGLPERQCGFLRVYSTVNAINIIVKGSLVPSGCWAVVAMDMKNAFNSAN